MHYFDYKGGQLFAEDIAVADLVHEYGTPLYIYSASTIKRHFTAFDSAFSGMPHLTCYSVKANSNLSFLKLLAEQGAGNPRLSGLRGYPARHGQRGGRAGRIREG